MGGQGRSLLLQLLWTRASYLELSEVSWLVSGAEPWELGYGRSGGPDPSLSRRTRAGLSGGWWVRERLFPSRRAQTGPEAKPTLETGGPMQLLLQAQGASAPCQPPCAASAGASSPFSWYLGSAGVPGWGATEKRLLSPKGTQHELGNPWAWFVVFGVGLPWGKLTGGTQLLLPGASLPNGAPVRPSPTLSLHAVT